MNPSISIFQVFDLNFQKIYLQNPSQLLLLLFSVHCPYIFRFFRAMRLTVYMLSLVQWEEKCELQIIDHIHTMI